MTLLVLFSILFISCKDNLNDVKKDSISILAYFSRVSRSNDYDIINVKFQIINNGESVYNASPSISSSSGELSALTSNNDGTYEFNLEPEATGEYPVSISYKGFTYTRTPIVLSYVDSDWGQPMSVSGLVNTEGYEDGVTITPDGEYLFVQTGPHYFMGVFAMLASRENSGCGGALNRLSPTRCEHPWINNLIGSYTSPERPGFFDGRFNGTLMRHNANSWQVGDDIAPNYAMSTMFYGFKRQQDGTFKNPFYVAFEDENDALINPFGLSFMMNNDGVTATTTFTFNDPTDPDMVDFDGDGIVDAESYFDVYTSQIILGQNNILGKFVPSGTPGTHPVRGANFNSTLVNFGKVGIEGIAGTQGNSHIYYDDNNNIKSIWVDDKFDSGGDHGELSVHVLISGTFPNGIWQKVQLPTKVNIAGSSDEIQQFFTGSGLYFTRSGIINPEVWYISYTGPQTAEGYADNNNWGVAKKILGMDNIQEKGRIVTVGEPTIGIYNGETYLYFVYGYNREFDGALPASTGLWDINMQAGYIKLNPQRIDFT